MQGSLLFGVKRSMSKMAAFAASGGVGRLLPRGTAHFHLRPVPLASSDVAVLRHSIQRTFTGSRMLSCTPLQAQNRRDFSAHAATVRFPGHSRPC